MVQTNDRAYNERLRLNNKIRNKTSERVSEVGDVTGHATNEV